MLERQMCIEVLCLHSTSSPPSLNSRPPMLHMMTTYCCRELPKARSVGWSQGILSSRSSSLSRDIYLKRS